jgi:hypothetical protein
MRRQKVLENQHKNGLQMHKLQIPTVRDRRDCYGKYNVANSKTASRDLCDNYRQKLCLGKGFAMATFGNMQNRLVCSVSKRVCTAMKFADESFQTTSCDLCDNYRQKPRLGKGFAMATFGNMQNRLAYPVSKRVCTAMKFADESYQTAPCDLCDNYRQKLCLGKGFAMATFGNMQN